MSIEAYAKPDYKRLFEQSPSLYMVLDPTLRIVAASDAYLKATLTCREEIIGRHVFDVFPDNPEDPSADAAVPKALASFNRVLQTRKPDVQGLQRHDVRKRESEGGGFEVRYWSAVNSPVLNPDGSLAYILHRVENITEFVLLKQQGAEQSKLTDELRERALLTEADLYSRSRELAESSRNLKEANQKLAQHQKRTDESVKERTAELKAANAMLQKEISERKRTEEALSQAVKRYEWQVRLFDGVASTTPDFVYLFDPLGRFLYANRRLLEVWGMKLPDVIGKTCRELGYEQWHHDMHMREIAQVIETRRPIKGEVPFMAPHTGIFGVYEYIFTPVIGPDGKVELIAGTTRDVTDRKRAEEALREAHDEMDLRVRERTAELERKNQELQEFAFVASHDLSEPLRKIQTFGTLLEGKNADGLDERSRDYLSRMTGAATRMQELLDALLRYSRVESKGQEFRPSKLDDIARDATTDLEVAIKKIEAQVEVSQLPIITGDPYQLRQLFQNLIANAVKYHRSEVRTFIKIHGDEDDGTVRIFVEDNGIGFDERYLEKIFQPFQRLHGRNEYAGTGIGLAICRKIVERHGGAITARSTPGKGSTFIVSLPTEKKQ
jgi:PAS domain S-box-containing protein